MKYDIITFGSVSRDIFLKANQFPIGDFKQNHIEEEILLPFGSKVDIKEIYFHSGGGGTNTAATFAAQGFKTAYCGVIGEDPEGEEVLRELKEKRIETEFVFRTDKKPTNVSVIFSTPKERTILVYKGASETLAVSKIPWFRIKNTKWFYLAPFSEKLTEVFKDLKDFAEKNQIKTMVNPSIPQLKLAPKILYPLLQKIDILMLNQEEGRVLVKSNLMRGEKLVKEIGKIFPGILILTNGENRVLISESNFLYSALPLKTKVLDKTGAGDAFGAGFLAGYIKSEGDINKSLKLAVANSASCIKKWGAKEGLLNKNQGFKKVKVKKCEKS